MLATAVLLDGMPELAHHAYIVLSDSINAETAVELANWATSCIQPSQHQSLGSGEGNGGEAKYGAWSTRIQTDV